MSWKAGYFEGLASQSCGIQVARLAGVPKQVVARAGGFCGLTQEQWQDLLFDDRFEEN